MGWQSYVVRFKDTVKVAEIVEVLNNHNTSDDPNIVGEEFVECGLWEVVTTVNPKIHVGQKRTTAYRCECGKEYKHNSTLSRHKTTCIIRGELVIMFGNGGGRYSSFDYLHKNLPKNSIVLDYGMLSNIAEFELVKKIQLKKQVLLNLMLNN